MPNDHQAPCPVCDAAVVVAGDAILNELISCPDCGIELEITALAPPALAQAPGEEEDWGQ